MNDIYIPDDRCVLNNNFPAFKEIDSHCGHKYCRNNICRHKKHPYSVVSASQVSAHHVIFAPHLLSNKTALDNTSTIEQSVPEAPPSIGNDMTPPSVDTTEKPLTTSESDVPLATEGAHELCAETLIVEQSNYSDELITNNEHIIPLKMVIQLKTMNLAIMTILLNPKV